MQEIIDKLLKLAKKAYIKDEIPVGCIIVDKNNKIIAQSYNKRQKKHSVIEHAEISCILKTSKKLKDWRLNDCVMYVTLKPCKMCEEIIKESRLKEVFYLAESTYKHNNESENLFIKMNSDKEKTYKEMLSNYFSAKR